MRAFIRRAASVAAVAGGVLTMTLAGPGAAWAATTVNAPARAGTEKNAASGIPKTMRHGQTVYMTLYYRQDSYDVLVPHNFNVSVWSPAANARDELRGITATWFDPVTHRWEKFSSATQEGDIDFDLPQSPILKVASGTLAHVYIRITFGKAAPSGLWHFYPQLTGESLLTKQGKPDYAYLDVNDKDIRMYTSTLRS